VLYSIYNIDDSLDKNPLETNDDSNGPETAAETPKTEKLVHVLLS
jgi:hypothetical protein